MPTLITMEAINPHVMQCIKLHYRETIRQKKEDSLCNTIIEVNHNHPYTRAAQKVGLVGL